MDCDTARQSKVCTSRNLIAMLRLNSILTTKWSLASQRRNSCRLPQRKIFCAANFWNSAVLLLSITFSLWIAKFCMFCIFSTKGRHTDAEITYISETKQYLQVDCNKINPTQIQDVSKSYGICSRSWQEVPLHCRVVVQTGESKNSESCFT